MKTLLITLLLSISIFGQSGKSVLTQAQKDSVRQLIGGDLIVSVADYAPRDLATDGSVDISEYCASAISDIGNRGGGIIYLPKGRFRANITLVSGITLKGANKRVRTDGIYGTTLLPTKDNDTIITFPYATYGAVLEDVNIDGVNSDGDTARIGIYMDTPLDCDIGGMTILDFLGGGIDTTYGIYIQDGNSLTIHPPFYIRRTDIGIYADSFQDLIVNTIRITNYTIAGILNSNSSNTLIHQCDIEAPTDTTGKFSGVRHGIWNKTSRQTLIDAIYMESHGVYGSSAIYVNETDGYNSDFTMVGGKISSDDNMHYAIIIDAERTFTNIYGTYIKALTAPIKIDKGVYKFLSCDFSWTNASTSSITKIKMDRYYTSDFISRSYIPSVDLNHYDTHLTGNTYMADSSMFSKGITISGVATNNSFGLAGTRINSVISTSGTGSLYGSLYSADTTLTDTIEITITHANTPGVNWNFMKAKMQLHWGNSQADRAFWGEVSVSQINDGSDAGERTFTVDSLYMPSTITNAPSFEFASCTDSTYTFYIISPDWGIALYFFAGWTEAINVKDISAKYKGQ